MDQAESLCESVCIIAGGEKVLDGGVRDVKRAHRGDHFRLRVDVAESADGLRELPGVLQRLSVRAQPSADGATWELQLNGCAPRDVLAVIATLPLEIDRFERVEPSLHEIFLERVGEAARRAPRREAPHA
jgi:ABC-2 type transport system ATP-binding protein